MATRGGTHFVISASLTDSGAPTYLARDGGWTPDLQCAAALATEAERDAFLEQALREERTVCDPYFFDVRVEGGTIDPLSARERIRAAGPTTRIRRPD
jgi:hypothetical protein